MAYKYSKGKTYQGDIYNEDDTQRNTYLDWSEDAVGFVAGGQDCLIISGSGAVSSSLNLSASAFYGDGSNLENITATASPAGSSGQIQFNDEGETGGAAEFYWDDDNHRVGIGASSPSQMLHVSGNLRVEDGYVSASAALYGSDLHLAASAESAATTIYLEGGSATEIISSGTGHLNMQSGGGLYLLAGTDSEIHLGTDGTNSKVVIDDDGKVGIGTSSPTRMLDIEGADSAGIQLNATNYHAYTVGSDAYGFTIFEDAGLGTAGYRFVISDQDDALGYVGIGAGASIAGSLHPDALLHLSSSDDGAILRADTTDGTTVLFATGSNRVGIGTSTPAYTLDVQGYISIGSNGTAYIINNNDINTNIKLGGSGTPGLDGMTFTCGGKAMLTLDENGLDTVSVGTSGDATDFKVMTANTDYALYVSGGADRVGIGTAAPQALFHISSSSEDDVFFQVSAPTWTATAVNPATKAELAGVLLKVTGSGIVFGGTNTYFDYGSVQIGDQSNGYGRLELGTGSCDDGDADLYRLTSWQGDFGIWDCHDGGNQICLNFDNTALTIYGTAEKPGGGSWSNSTSDRRLKENIINLTGSLAKIQQLQGRAYEWRVPEAHNGTTTAAGFIAQEIQEVFPEFVREAKLRDDAEKDLIPSGSALTYGLPDAFTAHLVEAIKEQQVIIGALTARVEQLEISGSQ